MGLRCGRRCSGPARGRGAPGFFSLFYVVEIAAGSNLRLGVDLQDPVHFAAQNASDIFVATKMLNAPPF